MCLCVRVCVCVSVRACVCVCVGGGGGGTKKDVYYRRMCCIPENIISSRFEEIRARVSIDYSDKRHPILFSRLAMV